MLRHAFRWLTFSVLLASLPSCGTPREASVAETKDVTPEGLTSGQLVWLTETRSAEFAHPAVVMGYWPSFDIPSTGSTGSLAWSLSTCTDIVRGCNVAPVDPAFAGNVADAAGRSGIPAGPLWETRNGSRSFNASAKAVLFSHGNMPTGRWTISAQLEYGIAPYFKDQPVGPDIGPIIGGVSLDVSCTYLNDNGKKRTKRLATDSKSYRYSTSSLSGDHIGLLSPVLDLGAVCADQGPVSEIALRLNVSNAQKFQFNGVHLSMASVD